MLPGRRILKFAGKNSHSRTSRLFLRGRTTKFTLLYYNENVNLNLKEAKYEYFASDTRLEYINLAFVISRQRYSHHRLSLDTTIQGSTLVILPVGGQPKEERKRELRKHRSLPLYIYRTFVYQVQRLACKLVAFELLVGQANRTRARWIWQNGMFSRNVRNKVALTEFALN